MRIKQHEADLVLKIYELRRDEETRKARKWYDTEFSPQSARDIVNLLQGSFAESAYFRQVTSYWEMVAAFVNRGAISPDLLHATNVEHLRVYAKLEPFVEEVRAKFGPGFLPELERAVKTAPGYKEKLKGWRELNEHWTKDNKTKTKTKKTKN